jgi:hypothetical protein
MPRSQSERINVRSLVNDISMAVDGNQSAIQSASSDTIESDSLNISANDINDIGTQPKELVEELSTKALDALENDLDAEDTLEHISNIDLHPSSPISPPSSSSIQNDRKVSHGEVKQSTERAEQISAHDQLAERLQALRQRRRPIVVQEEEIPIPQLPEEIEEMLDIPNARDAAILPGLGRRSRWRRALDQVLDLLILLLSTAIIALIMRILARYRGQTY